MITLPFKPQSGIKRDCTELEGENYADGQWVRFVKGLPRKIGGMKSVSSNVVSKARGIRCDSKGTNTYTHIGGGSILEQHSFDSDAFIINVADRTPSTLAYPLSTNSMWTFDIMYNASSSGSSIIAQEAPNLGSLYNDSGGQLCIGDTYSTSRLTKLDVPSGGSATGGVCVLHPYLFYYGNDGIVGWSASGEPTKLDPSAHPSSDCGLARVTGSKLVKMLPLRGDGPSGLMWSTDSLLRCVYSGSLGIFQFNTISTQISVLSPNSIVEYDGLYFWAGIDKFYVFTGTVKELPNAMNLDYFYDNVNMTYSQKVFAFVVPKYGEIWWCYPRGTNTECSHAVIYNVRENTWYDTELPTHLYSGVYSQFYGRPLTIGESQIYLHETGYDFISSGVVYAMKSYFESNDISFSVQKQQNVAIRCATIEPDFVQIGDIKVVVKGQNTPKDTPTETQKFTIKQYPETKYDQVVQIKSQSKYMRLRFESNVLGGYYYMGQTMVHYDTGTSRVL